MANYKTKTNTLTITVSPGEAPDGYTKFVRQSRINGYVDISDKEIMSQS